MQGAAAAAAKRATADTDWDSRADTALTLIYVHAAVIAHLHAELQV